MLLRPEKKRVRAGWPWTAWLAVWKVYCLCRWAMRSTMARAVWRSTMDWGFQHWVLRPRPHHLDGEELRLGGVVHQGRRKKETRPGPPAAAPLPPSPPGAGASGPPSPAVDGGLRCSLASRRVLLLGQGHGLAQGIQPPAQEEEQRRLPQAGQDPRQGGQAALLPIGQDLLQTDAPPAVPFPPQQAHQSIQGGETAAAPGSRWPRSTPGPSTGAFSKSPVTRTRAPGRAKRLRQIGRSRKKPPFFVGFHKTVPNTRTVFYRFSISHPSPRVYGEGLKNSLRIYYAPPAPQKHPFTYIDVSAQGFVTPF